MSSNILTNTSNINKQQCIFKWNGCYKKYFILCMFQKVLYIMHGLFNIKLVRCQANE